MKFTAVSSSDAIVEINWVRLPGGELEAPRPRARCVTCRAAIEQKPTGYAQRGAADGGPACFVCYRAHVAHERRLKAAAQFAGTSSARFQEALPFSPVDRLQLERLRSERLAERRASATGMGRFADRRRGAQLAARRALQCIGEGLRVRHLEPRPWYPHVASGERPSPQRVPESWLPHVVSQ